MNKKTLYVLWAGMYILCAGLGFIPEPQGAGRVVLTLLSLLFFVPPALLLRLAVQTKDKTTLLLIRNLSALSLGLTLLLIVLGIATAMGSVWLGNFLHAVLVIVSAPMICSGFWALSMFLWAFLMMAARRHCKK